MILWVNLNPAADPATTKKKEEMKDDTSIYNLINSILTSWNPLSVEGPALSDEYTGIIPSLIKLKKDYSAMVLFLKNITEQHYGLDCTDDEIKNVAQKIYAIH